MRIDFSLIKKEFFRTVIFGLILSIVGILLVLYFLPSGTLAIEGASELCHETIDKPSSTKFARRWDGSCAGWTTYWCVMFIIGSFLHWWSYTTVSIMIAINHPIIQSDWKSAWTVYLTSAFVFGCGLTHLFTIYTIFHPRYDVLGWLLLINGTVSVVAMFFVIYGLIRASHITNIRKQNLEKLL